MCDRSRSDIKHHTVYAKNAVHGSAETVHALLRERVADTSTADASTANVNTADTCMADAESERPFKGLLEQYGDKTAPRPLHPVAHVMAQFNGNPNLSWYPDVATLQNADGSCCIQYEDGDVEDLYVVPPGRKLPCFKHCN